MKLFRLKAFRVGDAPGARECPVPMVQEHRSEHPSLWSTIESIAPKTGCSAHTLLEWVRKHETDTGLRDGVTSEERDRNEFALTTPPK